MFKVDPNSYATEISGAVSGLGGIIKNGTGGLALAGANTFSGALVINNGLVEAKSATAFGSTAGGTILNDAHIVLQGAAIGNEPLTVTGVRIAGNLAPFLYGYNNSSWAGPITLNTDQSLHDLNVNSGGAGVTTLSGVISGLGGILIRFGTVRFSGSSGNTYTGTTRVTEGTLELQKSSGDAIAGPLVIGDGFGSDVVRLLTGTVIGGVPVTINGSGFNSSGLLDLNGYSDGIGALTLNGGQVKTGTGTLSLGGNVTTLASLDVASISGNLNLGGTIRIFNVADGAPERDLLINAVISGSGGITKTGAGDLVLRADNTYTGLTTINDGILFALDHANALGSTAARTIVNDGGTLRLGGAPQFNVSEPLTLSGNGFGGTNGALNGNNGVEASGDIILATPSAISSDLGGFPISGAISGTGPLTKTGTSVLYLRGGSDNTYSGDTLVNESILELAKTGGAVSIPGHLVIGTGAPFGPTAIARHLTSSTVNGSVTVNRGSLYDLNGQSESFTLAQLAGQPPLRLNDGGDVQTGLGLLTLPADTAVIVEPGVNGTSSISGRIGLSATMFSGSHTFAVNSAFAPSGPALTISASLEAISSTAHVTKTGPGEMRLTGNNTYTGQLVANRGSVTLASSTALGAAGGGAIVNSNAFLVIDGSLTINNETLTLDSTAPAPLTVLSGASIWDSSAAVNLNRNSTIALNAGSSLEVYGAISGPGTLTKTGTGALYFKGSTANTYMNTTTVSEGTLVLNNTLSSRAIVGPLIIGDAVGGADADVVRLDRVRQIGNSVPVTINSSGLLDINGLSDAFGALSGNGHVDLNGGILEANYPDATSTFDGVISGAGDFYKDGTGTLTLNGNNTYTGTTVIYADASLAGGTLLVNGSQQSSPVVISNGCTLGGSGTVGSITVAAGGTVSPGASAGILTCSGVTFSSGSTFRVELNGTTPGSGYDQLNVQSSTVQLGGATLNATMGFQSAAGATFTIINKTPAGAISGTFSGLTQNAITNISGIPFRISYTNGTGNDVVLTQLLPPPALSSVQSSSTNITFSWPTNYTGFTLECLNIINKRRRNPALRDWRGQFPAGVRRKHCVGLQDCLSWLHYAHESHQSGLAQ